MNAQAFDDIIRSFTFSISRRGLLAGLTSGLFAALPFALTADAAGKKKRKGKRKKKKKKNQQAPCVPNCAGRFCGDDGCGGPCGECVAKLCLSNGSCARVCDDPVIGCPEGCACQGPTTEGATVCTTSSSTCDQIPQVCASTAECPPLQTCMATGCGPNFNDKRCHHLCTT